MALFFLTASLGRMRCGGYNYREDAWRTGSVTHVKSYCTRRVNDTVKTEIQAGDTGGIVDLPMLNGYYCLLMKTHSDTCTDHLQR